MESRLSKGVNNTEINPVLYSGLSRNIFEALSQFLLKNKKDK